MELLINLGGILVDEKEFFKEITLHTCCSLKVEKALYQSFLYLRDYIPADQMTLNFYDEVSGELVVLASATVDGGIFCNKSIALKPEERQLFTGPDTIMDQMYLNKTDDIPIIQKYLVEFGAPESSIMLKRLRIDGDVKGSLIIRAAGKNRFSEEDLKLFSLLENPWTIVMINNRQYRELEDLKELLADDNKYLHKSCSD